MTSAHSHLLICEVLSYLWEAQQPQLEVEQLLSHAQHHGILLVGILLRDPWADERTRSHHSKTVLLAQEVSDQPSMQGVRAQGY